MHRLVSFFFGVKLGDTKSILLCDGVIFVHLHTGTLFSAIVANGCELFHVLV